MAEMVLQLLISGILLGGVYALVSIGLTLIFGVLDVVNFAHGEFLMIGMYAVFWLCTLLHMDPYLSILLVAPLLFFIGLFVGRTVIQQTIGAPSSVQIFATVGVSLILMNGALVLWKADFRSVATTYGSGALAIGPIFIGYPQLISFIGAIFFSAMLFPFLRYTYIGKAIRATAQNRRAAMLMGIDIQRIYVFTFGIGISLVGIASALLAPIYSIHPAIGSQFVLVAYVAVVLGGLGNIPGAILGSIIIGITETFSGFFISPGWRQGIYYAVFIMVLIFRPQGLFGQKQ
jgi:branched-chain amino acid transport system permease protein